MMPASALLPFGNTVASNAFQLSQPTQVQINIQGSCQSANGAFLETVLEYLSPTSAPLVISRTDIDTSVPTRFSNGASLWLQAGQYRWIARLLVKASGTIVGGDIVGQTTLFNDPSNPILIGRCGAAGSANGFTVASIRSESPVTASAIASALLQAGERVSLSLLITEIATGDGVQTPEAVIVGPGQGRIDTSATPYWLKANRLYRIGYDLSAVRTLDLNCAVSVSAG